MDVELKAFDGSWQTTNLFGSVGEQKIGQSVKEFLGITLTPQRNSQKIANVRRSANFYTGAAVQCVQQFLQYEHGKVKGARSLAGNQREICRQLFVLTFDFYPGQECLELRRISVLRRDINDVASNRGGTEP